MGKGPCKSCKKEVDMQIGDHVRTDPIWTFTNKISFKGTLVDIGTPTLRGTVDAMGKPCSRTHRVKLDIPWGEYEYLSFCPEDLQVGK